MTPWRNQLEDLLPILAWSRDYNRQKFSNDLVAGVVVLFITIPQTIAYAYLAGMPPQTGLYAAVIALTVYSLFGTSRALAVGPTAIVAMMTLEAASVHSLPGEAGYETVVVQLCALTGLIMIGLRIINFGAVVAFLSHAVVTGFISAAALLIILNQVPSLLGLDSAADTSLLGVGLHLADQLPSSNLVVLAISAVAILLLLFCRSYLGQWLEKRPLKQWIVDALVRSAPMYVVVLGIVVVALTGLNSSAGVPVVGDIPVVVPDISLPLPDPDVALSLLPSAFLIALVIFMESTSIATAVASKSREKIRPNHELVGLGASNLGVSLVGGFPVAGSFARTIVNFSSGASTQVASLITALGVTLVLMLFVSLFFHLPKSVLSAIIVVSAWQLIDVQVIRKIFAFNRTDSMTFTGTFLMVLAFGVEAGVLTGIVISFVLLIRNSSKPHIATVGRVGDSEHFRNVARFETRTSPRVLALRIDESLYFVNTRFIETHILNKLAEAEEVEHLLLICTATNFIDTSGLEMLEELAENLHEAGVTLHLAEVKSPVMDQLKKTDFYRHMKGQIFFTTDLAMKELAGI